MIPVEVHDRFRADWASATQADGDAPTLVALSGGPDSVALLLLLDSVFPGTVSAATVDHGLRPEAAGEAAWAGDLCRSLGVDHVTLTAPFPDRADRTANLSARARVLRYRLLVAHAEKIGARWIATAHHADDQLETLVMRLNRGSGVSGMVGIRTRDGRIVRPLLHWRRAELAALVEGAGLVAIQDPSNTDDRFDRARLRKRLATADWLDPVAAARSASALSDADGALDWMADRLAAETVVLAPQAAALRPAGLPAELLRRLVMRCLRHLEPGLEVRAAAMSRLIGTLDAGGTQTIGNILCYCTMRDDGPAWGFIPAPPRRST